MKQITGRILGMLLLAFTLLSTWTAQGASTSNTATNNASMLAEAPSPTNAPPALNPAPALTSAVPNVWLTFGLNRISVLQYKPLAGIPLWQFLASFIYVFLAFYISKLLDFVIRERLQKWAEKTKTKFDDIVISLLRGPIKVVSFVVLLHIGMKVYSWPQSLSEFLSIGLKIIVALSITYVLLKAVDAMVGVWRERTTTAENEQFSRQLLPLISKTIKVFLVIVMVLVTSQNLGLNVTGLIASLSIGGLAIGLAAQDTLANLFGAVAVLIDKPFKVGDRIQLENVDGTVETIGFRSTRIRNLDGHLVTVPNKTMGNATIVNVTLRPTLKTVINLGVTYDTPPEKVEKAVEIVRGIYKGQRATADVQVTFDKFLDSSLNILVVHWWNGSNYNDYLRLMQECNLSIKRRFEEEQIQFAFPSRTVYYKNADLNVGEPHPVELARPGPETRA